MYEQADNKFVIWVVGHGDTTEPASEHSEIVSHEKTREGDFLYNAFWTGAAIGWRQAIREHPDIDQLVVLRPNDDQHSPDEASKVALRIRSDVNTLAVIGHDQSNTTANAEPIYAEAAIPVVFPAATSSHIGYRPAYKAGFFRSADNTDRAVNFVRLPPADVPYQAHALRVAAYKIAEKEKLGSAETKLDSAEKLTLPEKKMASAVKKQRDKPEPKAIRIFVVSETSQNASVYSQPLADELLKDDRFSKLVVGERKFDRDQLDVYTLVTSIIGSRTDLVVFIGYPDSAKDLLQEMKERKENENRNARNKRSPENKKKSPIFLLSDACLDGDLVAPDYPLPIYVTSSTLPIKLCDEPSKKYNDVFHELRALDRPITGEIYAADAALLLADAADQCNKQGKLGRICVMSYLRSQRDIRSVCRPYHVDEGESRNAWYLLYSLTSRDELGNPTYTGLIRNEDQNLFKPGKLQ